MAAADEAQAAGRKVYVEQCSVCHSIGGAQAFGPDLAGVAKRPRFTDSPAALGELILRGEGRMPGIPLQDEDLQRLLAYLQTV